MTMPKTFEDYLKFSSRVTVKIRKSLPIDIQILFRAFEVEFSRIYFPTFDLCPRRRSLFLIKACAVGLLRSLRIFRFCLGNIIRPRQKLKPSPSAVVYLHFTRHLADALLPPIIAENQNHPVVILSEAQSSTFFSSDNVDAFVSWTHHIGITDLVLGVFNQFVNLSYVGWREFIKLRAKSRTGRAVDVALYRFYLAEYLQLFVAYRVIDRILQQIKPSSVVGVDTANSLVRLAFELSPRNSSSICLQGGLSAPWSTEWRFCNANIVCVWGEYFSKLIEQQGVEKSRIVVTGSPRFDTFFHPMVSKGSCDSTFSVLVLSTFNTDIYRQYSSRALLDQMKSDIMQLAADNKAIHVAIKPHPSETTADIFPFVPPSSNVTVLDRRSSLADALCRSDVVLSFGSTATLDALLLGKTVGLMGYPGWHWVESFAPVSTCRVITSRSSLISFLGDTKELASSADPTGALLAAGWISPGNSSSRVQSVISTRGGGDVKR